MGQAASFQILKQRSIAFTAQIRPLTCRLVQTYIDRIRLDKRTGYQLDHRGQPTALGSGSSGRCL